MMYLRSQTAMQAQDMGSSFRGPGARTAAPEYRELLEYNHKLLAMYYDLMEKNADLMSKHVALVEKTAGGGAVTKAPARGSIGQGTKAGGLAAVTLGIVRLDYDYPPSPGDIDCPDSYGYDVHYRVVPGFTFEMCQAGRMTPEVERNFVEAIKWLVAKGCSGITGDCGFMMNFQKLARMHCSKPVFMSSLAILPAVTCGFNKHEMIAIFTANGKTLAPMRPLIRDECGIDPEERRYIFVGCEDIPGFEAVAEGGKVDVQKVTPGMVQKGKEILAMYPQVKAILLECTELPPYADALRQALRIPVWDAITCCDFFISGCKDNERFGIQGWQQQWDGVQEKYSYGANLTKEEQSRLVNKVHGS